MEKRLKTRIFEIFTSVEGEGILYGTKTLFVRLAGCPYACFYCDTLDALPLDSGKEYSINEACNLIDKNLQENTYKVNFTGGEPLIQYEAVSELAKHAKSRGIPTYLESACFDSQKFLHVLPSIDFVKIEFKTIDSEFIDEKHYPELVRNTLECLQAAVKAKKTTYIKIVVSSKTKMGSFKALLGKIFDSISKQNISGFIIQPTSSISEPTLEQLLKFYDSVYPYYDEVRVVPQLHKIINAP
jgi:organic radical activating enzyme